MEFVQSNQMTGDKSDLQATQNQQATPESVAHETVDEQVTQSQQVNTESAIQGTVDEQVTQSQGVEPATATQETVEQFAPSAKAPALGLSDDHSKHTRCESCHASSILKELNKQRQSGQHTDVTLSCQGELFLCHKAVLAASSPYFKDKFNDLVESESRTDIVVVELDDIKSVIVTGDESNTVEINQIKPVALKKIIDFVYTSQLDVDAQTAPDLLVGGKVLQYPDVVSSCCNVLQASLSPSTCLEVSQLAKKQDCTNLYHQAWDYALTNFHDVVMQETFLTMSSEQLQDYIADERLKVKCEDEVFLAAMFWVNHNKDERLPLLPQLLTHIRLPLLSNNLIQDALLNDTTFKASQKSVDQLKDADNLKDLAKKAKQLKHVKLKPRPSTFTEVLAIIGGMKTDRSWSRDISYYNPSEEEWNHLTELPFLTTDYSISALGTSIYVIGGYKKELEEPTSEVWKYDTLLEKWCLISHLKVPRFNHTSTTLDGRLYVIGGENDVVGLTELEVYDPLTDSWEILGKTNEMESNITAAGINHKLYITGWLVHPRQTCVTQCFDLATKECIVLPCSGLNRQIFPTVLLNGSIYLLGASRIKEVSMYDPATYKLTKVESMRYKRNSPSAAVVGGKIYVTGGELRHHLDKGEVYDPETDVWTAIPSMPYGLCFHGCVGVMKYLGPPFFEPPAVKSVKNPLSLGAGDACDLDVVESA